MWFFDRKRTGPCVPIHPGDPSDEDRFERATTRYCFHLDHYEREARRSRIKYQFFQTAAVVLGGLTPVLVLAGGVDKWIQALPSALASVSAGMVGFSQWRENWIRYRATSEAMKHERALLDTRTAPYKMGLGDTVILERFVGEIERLAMEETSGWQRLVGGDQRVLGEKEKGEKEPPAAEGGASDAG